MDLNSHLKLIEEAVDSQNIVFIKSWPKIAESLAALSNEPVAKIVSFSIQLLNKIILVQSTTFQRHALPELCTHEFLSQLKNWFCNVDRENFSSAIDAAYVLRKYIMKAREFELIASKDMFSITYDLAEAVHHLTTQIGCRDPDLLEVAKSASNDFDQLDLLLLEVINNDIFSEYANLNFLKTMEISKPQNVSEYIVWLYTSLKGDFQLGLKDQLRQESERSSTSFKAKVKVVSMKRQMVTPSNTVSNIIDIGFEISRLDFLRFSDYDGASKNGSLCFLSKDKDSKRIPVLTGRTVDESNGFLFVNFDVVGKHQISPETTYLLEWSTLYFEPYARVLSAFKYLVYDELPILDYLLRPTIKGSNGNSSIISNINWSHSCSKMNSKQKICVSSLFQKPVTLIQGPPGTGKTHVCVQMINALFENRDTWDPDRTHQVLVISMKNDTLDKLLMALIEDNRKVVRIGGMSKVSDLRSLYNVSAVGRKLVPSFKHVVEELAIAKETMSTKILNLQTKLHNYANGIIPLAVLEHYMHDEHSAYFRRHPLTEWLFELEEKMDNSTCITRLREIRTNKRSISRCPQKFTMLTELEEDIRRQADDIQSNDDLSDLFVKVQALHNAVAFHRCVERLSIHPYDPDSSLAWKHFHESIELLNREERWSIYNFWKNALQRECYNTLFSQLNNYQENEKSLREVYQMASAVSITRKEIEVIGATSCAAAKHRVLIENLKPKLIIIEEAAELLESHIVVSLTKSTTSMILIGDHCQLAPSPASLLRHMKVSLFQRLIDEGLEPLVLDEQFRMRPEISKLVSLLSYPFLVDGNNVRKYPHIHGLKYNMFFLDISHREKMTACASFSNDGETERVVQICCFLVEQGYDPKRITVLSPYNGQVRLINSILRRSERTADVNAIAVDGYQGEENEIIVLSLVRSNCEGRIGFLGDKRRVAVAFSRAKLGLFVVGDIATMRLSKDPSWDVIINYFEENGLTGPDLPLWCQLHSHGKYLNDYNPTDGFCPFPCPLKLSCGHPCLYRCHGGDKDHKREFKCSSGCERFCSAGHQCASLCSGKCLCEVKLEKKLPCGHMLVMHCGRTPSQEYCEAQSSVTLKCGHITQVMCRSLSENYQLPDCFEVCGKLNEACQHTCQKRCCEDCNPCVELVYTTLSCGHTVQKACGTEAPKVVCTATCEKKLPCGHVCYLWCAEDCLCRTVVFKPLCDYGHTAEMLCSEPVMPCKAPCVKTMDDCGHKCKNLCSEVCLCVELVPAVIPCGHPCDIPCYIVKNRGKHDDYEVGKWCTKPCGQELPCSHLCTGECGLCIQGILHKKCEANCTEVLLCGHSCNALCSDLVHVCKEAKCLSESPTAFHDKLQPKGKGRRMRTLFDITREINSILQAKPQPRNPNIKTFTSKRSLIPKIKQKLTSFVIGPLYEKIIRIPNTMLEKNALAHGLISNLMMDVRDVWLSRIPTARFLKNLIFKMEFSVLLVRYHLDLENKELSEPALNLTLLARILKIAELQEYTFSWDQILQLVDFVRYEGRPVQFQYTLQYVKPLSDHLSDKNPQTWLNWID